MKGNEIKEDTKIRRNQQQFYFVYFLKNIQNYCYFINNILFPK